MLDQPVNSSDLDATSSVGVFKSRSVLQQPSEDFYHEGIPIWRAVLLVVNAALGAGILNFPQAYAECGGILTAIVIQMVSLCLLRSLNFYLVTLTKSCNEPHQMSLVY